jgi:hypothetical protein
LIVACDITFAFASSISDEAGRAAYCTASLSFAFKRGKRDIDSCAKLSRLQTNKVERESKTVSACIGSGQWRSFSLFWLFYRVVVARVGLEQISTV